MMLNNNSLLIFFIEKITNNPLAYKQTVSKMMMRKEIKYDEGV